VEIGQNAQWSLPVRSSLVEGDRAHLHTSALRTVLEPKIHNRAHATSAAYPTLP
jgi:hypothetical protein